MPRNVEIKARVKDITKLKQQAELLCKNKPEILKQQDTFYKVSAGRLKLRDFEENSVSQLIFYNRPDSEEAKISDYSIAAVNNPFDLKNVLKSALGEVGVVKKTRYLYLYGQTRIHVDEVAGLGHFIELEVVLTPDQTLQDGQLIARELMLKLEIPDSDLISGAYLDHLIQD